MAERKFVYLAAGASDMAMEQLRKLPDRVSVLRGRLETELGGLRGRAESARTVLADVDVRSDLERVRRAAQRNASGFVTYAQQQADTVQSRAAETYEEMIDRGQKVVRSVRRQKATQELSTSAENTVRAAKRATTTARKAAASTRTSAKGATTSARKTARAAGRAASDGASKLG